MSEVYNPKHYTSHPSGIECIEIVEHMGFLLGNAIKYIWRADLKGKAIQDLEKAKWYIEREIQKRKAEVPQCAAGNNYIAPAIHSDREVRIGVLGTAMPAMPAALFCCCGYTTLQHANDRIYATNGEHTAKLCSSTHYT